jgi:hypothetical protein
MNTMRTSSPPPPPPTSLHPVWLMSEIRQECSLGFTRRCAISLSKQSSLIRTILCTTNAGLLKSGSVVASNLSFQPLADHGSFCWYGRLYLWNSVDKLPLLEGTCSTHARDKNTHTLSSIFFYFVYRYTISYLKFWKPKVFSWRSTPTKYDGHHDNDDDIDVPSSPGSSSKV